MLINRELVIIATGRRKISGVKVFRECGDNKGIVFYKQSNTNSWVRKNNYPMVKHYNWVVIFCNVSPCTTSQLQTSWSGLAHLY